jgi:probable rRNA maturation factor
LGEGNMNIEVNIINEYKKYDINNNAIINIVKIIMEEELKDKFSPDELHIISIKICDNDYIRKAHKEYLGVDKVTDLISFSIDEVFEAGLLERYWGDILVSLERAIEVSGNYKNTWQKEFILYIIHGVLHLLGYDDINEKDRVIMRKKEQEYLKRVDKEL